MKQMIVCLIAAMSVVWAAAVSGKVTLYQPATLKGVELKPGDYRVKVDGDKLTLESGKVRAEATVKSEEKDQKFSATSVRYQNVDGKLSISEIRIGGTNTTLVVN